MVRPARIVMLAAAMIAVGAIGVVANLYAYALGDPSYPKGFWLLFAGLKGLGLFGGLLLLQMRRAGIWFSLASFVLGVMVALLATGNVPAWQWAGAAMVSAMILGLGWLAVHNHWHELRPSGRNLGAR